jgi:hypothetical protein
MMKEEEEGWEGRGRMGLLLSLFHSMQGGRKNHQSY